MSNRNDRLKRRLEGLSTPPMRTKHDGASSNLTSGDKVRVQTSAEAIDAGLAGMVGEVISTSTSIDADFAVIGKIGTGGVVNVSFQEREGTFWFARNQLGKVGSSETAVIKNTEGEMQPIEAKSKPWWRLGF
jgi:hypothetical protein